jgi:hypothetical protein
MRAALWVWVGREGTCELDCGYVCGCEGIHANCIVGMCAGVRVHASCIVGWGRVSGYTRVALCAGVRVQASCVCAHARCVHGNVCACVCVCLCICR